MGYLSENSETLLFLHTLQFILIFATCTIYTFQYSTEGFNYYYNNIGTWSAILTIALSLCLISIYHYNKKYNIRLLFSIAIVITIYGLLFVAPTSNGYFINGRGSDDVLVHLGTVKQIISNHTIVLDNWYPLIHVLTTEFYFFGIELRLVVPILSFSFFLSFLIFIPLIARSGISPEYTLPAFVVAAVPIFSNFHTTFHPAILSTLYLPVVMFLLLKRFSWIKSTILLLPVITAIVFFHPSTTLLILLPMLILSIVFRYSKKYGIFYLASYIFVLSASWYTESENWGSLVNTGVAMVLGVAQPTADQQAQEIAASDPTIVELLVPFVTQYGPIWLYGLVASFYTVHFILNFREYKNTRTKLWFVGNFVLGSVSGVVFLFFTIIGRSPVRIAKYAALFSVILAGLSYGKLISKPSPRIIKRCCAIVLLLLICSAIFVSVPNFYPEANQFTSTEDKGTSWTHQFTRPGAQALSHDVGDDTLQYYSADDRELFGTLDENEPPGHLDGIEQTGVEYFVAKAYDRYAYDRFGQNSDSNITYYTPADLQRNVVHSNNSVKIYTNGGYTLWRIGD